MSIIDEPWVCKADRDKQDEERPMSEIPEDIMDTAESIRVNYVIPDPAGVRLAIAEAILAERQKWSAYLQSVVDPKWQPIETAPTDGSDVDLWVSDERAIDFHMDKFGRWCRVEGYPTYVRILTAKPTHWRHLPSPPKP